MKWKLIMPVVQRAFSYYWSLINQLLAFAGFSYKDLDVGNNVPIKKVI